VHFSNCTSFTGLLLLLQSQCGLVFTILVILSSLKEVGLGDFGIEVARHITTLNSYTVGRISSAIYDTQQAEISE